MYGDQLQEFLRIAERAVGGLNNPWIIGAQIASPILLLATVVVAIISIRVGRAESQKDRAISKLPYLRVVDMGRRKNPKSPEWYKERRFFQDPKSKEHIKEHKEHFYIVLQNAGKDAGMAFISSVKMWFGNSPTRISEEVDFEPVHFKDTLFPGEKDEIIHYNVHPPEGVKLLMLPQKVEVVYEDIWHNTITYTAVRRYQVAKESLPFYGLKDYFGHHYELDKNLQAARSRFIS